jgi:hypothetical protein
MRHGRSSRSDNDDLSHRLRLVGSKRIANHPWNAEPHCNQSVPIRRSERCSASTPTRFVFWRSRNGGGKPGRRQAGQPVDGAPAEPPRLEVGRAKDGWGQTLAARCSQGDRDGLRAPGVGRQVTREFRAFETTTSGLRLLLARGGGPLSRAMSQHRVNVAA